MEEFLSICNIHTQRVHAICVLCSYACSSITILGVGHERFRHGPGGGMSDLDELESADQDIYIYI